jgi:hypothetical protein
LRAPQRCLSFKLPAYLPRANGVAKQAGSCVRATSVHRSARTHILAVIRLFTCQRAFTSRSNVRGRFSPSVVVRSPISSIRGGGIIASASRLSTGCREICSSHARAAQTTAPAAGKLHFQSCCRSNERPPTLRPGSGTRAEVDRRMVLTNLPDYAAEFAVRQASKRLIPAFNPPLTLRRGQGRVRCGAKNLLWPKRCLIQGLRIAGSFAKLRAPAGIIVR